MEFASKIFIVLSPQLEEAKLCDGITDLQLQNYLIPYLPLNILVDDDFIAGFCHRGVVDIIPLAHHNDLEVYVRKNMLTINMSASVYSAFGLAGVKFMCNNRKMYHFNIHLGWPTFKRNDNAHMRLRNFFNSDEVTSRRPPGPCVVRWAVNKNIDWTRAENGGLSESPHPFSLARFLSPDFRIAIPTVEVCNLEAGAEVPRFVEVNPESDHPSGTSVDQEAARAAHNTLQQMALGVYPASDSYMPPLNSRRGFSPEDVICLRGATILTISGIFTVEQCQKLEELLTDVVRTSPSENSVAFFASCQIESDQSALITEKKKENQSSTVFFQKLLAPVFTSSRPHVLVVDFAADLTCMIKD